MTDEKLIEALAGAAELVVKHGCCLWSDGPGHEFIDTRKNLRAALSAFRSNTDGGWRPEVRAFADAMEARLRANDHRPGWKVESVEYLMSRFSEECEELRSVLAKGHVGWVVLHEAADVANFAMMIADVCGALPAPKPEGQGDG